MPVDVAAAVTAVVAVVLQLRVRSSAASSSFGEHHANEPTKRMAPVLRAYPSDAFRASSISQGEYLRDIYRKLERDGLMAKRQLSASRESAS